MDVKNGSKFGGKNNEQSSSKKVQFKNTVIAFINDEIDFWNYKCRTEPLHTNKQSKKYHEKSNGDSCKDNHIKNNKRRRKKK